MAVMVFCAFAERVTVDLFSNTLDLHNVVEQLVLSGVPPTDTNRGIKDKRTVAVPIRLCMIVLWRRSNPQKSEGMYKGRIEFYGPRKKLLHTFHQDFSLRENPFLRNVVNFPVLPLDGPGLYVAKVSLKSGRAWRQMGEASFFLTFDNVAPFAPTAPKTDRPNLH